MVQKINLTYSIYSKNNEKIGTQNLDFTMNNNTNNNIYIIHKALQAQLTEKRLGNAHTKTRSEVRGGGKKPWKQKGTGRARAGSTRSPLWKNGGIIFGPKNRQYYMKINKKEKILAIKTLIYNKYSQTTLIDQIGQNLKKPKTKLILKELEQYGILPSVYLNTKILIIVDIIPQNLYLSIKNKSNIELISANNLNNLSLIKAEKLIITSKALDIMNNHYN
uniref:Large ribosomal subunit protein uL4c n=1 Tax=Callithamnion tetricum TaxID=193179 RepID=A0A4D6WNH4_9FLOR|nr:ribosomal protein L4 [Callithamnion tetricum]